MPRPRMPKSLSPLAQEKWKELVRLMNKRQTLTVADATLLETASELYARWRMYSDDVVKRGPYVEQTRIDKHGEPHVVSVLNPSTKLATQMENGLRAALKALGLTPASREDVRPAPPAKDATPKSVADRIAALKGKE